MSRKDLTSKIAGTIKLKKDLKDLKIDLTEKQISNLPIKEWEKIIKQSVVKSIENDLRKDNGSKTRLIRKSSFGIKQYIKYSEAPKLLKLKLHMVEVKANFREKMKMLSVGGVELMRNMSNICGNAPYLKIKTCLILQT